MMPDFFVFQDRLSHIQVPYVSKQNSEGKSLKLKFIWAFVSQFGGLKSRDVVLELDEWET